MSEISFSISKDALRSALERLSIDGVHMVAKVALDVEAERRIAGRLTPRQIEVANLLREGCSDKEIAERLGRSLSTARQHVEAVLRRLDVCSRKALIDGDFERYPREEATVDDTRSVLEEAAYALGFMKLSNQGQRALSGAERRRLELIEDAIEEVGSESRGF